MKRPKYIDGQLYHIKGYDVGKGGVPLKTYREYVVRYLRRDKTSLTAGHQILILATNQVKDNKRSYLGIPLSEYEWHTQNFVDVSPYHRIIYSDGHKGKRSHDCMDIRKFNMEELPLCMGWCYYSQELLDYLKAA